MTSHKRVLAFAVFLFGLSVAPVNGQQVVTLGAGDSITVTVEPSHQDTLPAIQDTLPAIQDTLPVYQDTLAAYQDTLPAYQDTLVAYQDTLPPYQDTIPCLCDTIPVPPDTIPEPPADSSSGPPLSVSGISGVIEDSTLIITFAERPQPDRAGNYTEGYRIGVGNNTNGQNVVVDSVVSGSPVRVILNKGEGSYWFCVEPFNNFGDPGGSCTGIVYTFPIPPPVVSAYLLNVSALRRDMTGVQDVVEGDYYIHIDRPDGAWLGQGDISMPGVDSVVFVLDGFSNRERVYPYEATGGLIVSIPVGTHTVTWEVYGDQPDSGQASFNVISSGTEPDPPITDPVAFNLRQPIEMQGGLMVSVDGVTTFPTDSTMRFQSIEGYTAELRGGPTTEAFMGTVSPDTSDGCANRDCTPLGWYWLPAPDDGTVTVRDSTGLNVYRATYIKIDPIDG